MSFSLVFLIFTISALYLANEKIREGEDKYVC